MGVVYWKKGGVKMERFDSISVPLYRSAGLEERGTCITIAGCYSRVHTHNLPPRQVSEWILILCTEGGGWVQMEGQPRRAVTVGQLLVLPPQVTHSYGNGPDGWTVQWVHCTGGVAQLLCQRICAGKPAGIPLAAAQAQPLLEQILHRLKNGRGLSDVLYAEALLTQLLCGVLESVQSNALDGTQAATVQAAVQFLQNTTDYTLSLDDLAAQMGLSKYYLIKLFRQYTGDTPMEYFQQVRLRRACGLLSTTSLSVAQISEQLGYSSPFHFSGAFKRCFGVSPSRYRRLL